MSQQIINGDSAEVLKQFENNSIDAVITDPPYGIEFLGKEWDQDTGAVEIWRECLRVLKPGGHLLAFSAARTYHHLATNIESVGFDIRDQIMWIYASGFPKAQDIGRSIQRRQGVEKTKEVKDDGSKSKHYDYGMKKSDQNQMVIPTSEEAKQWAGWKTALKPAHEPIVMARKPMRGSAMDNVLQHGVGALNIDASRVPGGKDDNLHGRFPSNVLGEVAEPYQKYFYSPKVSRRERHTGHEMPAAMFGQHKGAYDDDGQRYAVELDRRTGTVGNNHPTVKPVALMRYLVRLVTAEGAHIIDPFAGSGSTGMACRELARRFTGIELDPNYCEIARRRIAATPTDPRETLFE
jgi:DNA modification methylase